MVNPPFKDSVQKDRLIANQGAFYFLPVAIKRNNALVVPDASTFSMRNVAVVKDKTGADITASFVSNTRDPAGIADPPNAIVTDTFDAASAYYVGGLARRIVSDGVTVINTPNITSATAAFSSVLDVGKVISGVGIPNGATILSVQSATQATLSANATASGTSVAITIGTPNVGLFADGAGRLALKIHVPNNETVDYLSATDSHSVEWRVRVPDGTGGNVLLGPTSEIFHVAPAGTILFEDVIITAADITKGISTSMDPTQISDLVTQALDLWFTGEVISRSSGTLTAPLAYIGPNGKRALISKAREEIFTFDVSSGVIMTSVREGPDSVQYGDRKMLIEKYEKEANAALKLYLREVLGTGKPFVGRTDTAREINSPPLVGLIIPYAWPLV